VNVVRSVNRSFGPATPVRLPRRLRMSLSPQRLRSRLSPSLPSFAFPERVPPGSRRCSPEFFHLWPCSASGFRPLQPSARASMHHTRTTPRSPRVSFTGAPPSHCTSSLDATHSERTRLFSRTPRLRMDARRASSYASPPSHMAPRIRSRRTTRMYSTCTRFSVFVSHHRAR
jgi:hypothetical protein